MLETCKQFFWLHAAASLGMMFYLYGGPGIAAAVAMNTGWLIAFGGDLDEDISKGRQK